MFLFVCSAVKYSVQVIVAKFYKLAVSLTVQNDALEMTHNKDIMWPGTHGIDS